MLFSSFFSRKIYFFDQPGILIVTARLKGWDFETESTRSHYQKEDETTSKHGHKDSKLTKNYSLTCALLGNCLQSYVAKLRVFSVITAPTRTFQKM